MNGQDVSSLRFGKKKLRQGHISFVWSYGARLPVALAKSRQAGYTHYGSMQRVIGDLEW
jgi:hypothetical protein